MRRTRIIGVLTVAALLGTALAAAPRYLNSIEMTSDPMEILQRRIDVLEMQVHELTERGGTDELSEPLAAGELAAPGGYLAGK